MTFPTFPGHFDDDPLVPGAALLVWVQTQVPGLVGFRRVRFLHPVRPGDEVELATNGDGFEIRDGERVCCRGTIARSDADGAGILV